ncbi:MAG TPA: alkylmercury lyase family protein [Saprospiraceae bacterium]|nr:alkylmercury lyase family protein [Saprospiraceae bacterium]
MTNAQEFHDKIRLQINRFIFYNGFAPDVDELAAGMFADPKRVEEGLHQLAEDHALVLHPDSSKIWVAHPFALFPTLFWVESGDKQWWGNCAWCALGIAALAKEDTRIFTTIGGEEDRVIIEIRENDLMTNDLLVHFPIPAKRLWDNVLYTCANTLVFKTENQVDEWCQRHRVPKGEVHSMDRVWELSKLWYGYYLDDDWKRKTPEIAENIFREVGFSGEFWKMR